MLPKALMAAGLVVSGAAFAQTYDVDGDGDIDSDDWQATAPPLIDADGDGYADTSDMAYAQPPPSAPTQQSFQSQLAPYGAWYQEPGVGYVWQPSPSVVGYDFVPYSTGGSWVATPAGWQFRTSYSFGGLPFHYGRWFRSARYGWVWWPSTTWAPAWVDWRCNSAGNVAWAPLPPPGFSVGFSLGAPGWTFAFGRYRSSYVSVVPRHWGQRSYGYGHRGGGYRGYGYGYGPRYGGGHYGGSGSYFRDSHLASPPPPQRGFGGGGYRPPAPPMGGGYHSAGPVRGGGGGHHHGGGHRH